MNPHDDRLYAAFSGDAKLPETLSPRLAEAYDAIRLDGRGKETDMKSHTKNHVRTMLLIAAAAVILTVSALAVYSLTVRDALLPETVSAEAGVQPTPEVRSGWLRLSANGFSDSPEYKAYAEWTAWNDAWWEENPNPWAELGEDDSYYETERNYATLYDAIFPEQGEKLDEIMAKYGLTPHTAMVSFRSEDELCQALGVADIFSDDYLVRGDYMFDDGSFKAYVQMDGGGMDRSGEIFVAAKGSFSMIFGFLPADYTEWTYTAADGTEVILATGHADGTEAEPDVPQDRAYILAELDGAYLNAGFYCGADRTTLERWADGIDFAALNAIFAPGGDRSSIAEAVAALDAVQQAAMAEETANFYAPFADRNERDAAVFADLGHYTVTDLPEGYVFLYNSAEWKSDKLYLLWDLTGDGSTATSGGSTWKGDDSDGVWRFLHLSYQRYFDRNDMETDTTALEFANEKAYYAIHSAEYSETTVKSYDAILVRGPEGSPGSHYLIWFDTDRNLEFRLSDEAWDEEGDAILFTDAELIAMAESVAAD